MIKEFINSLKQSKIYRKNQLFIIVIFVILTVSTTIVPFIVRNLIDTIQTGHISTITIINFSVIFVILIINRILSFIVDYLFRSLSILVSSDKRVELLNTIFTASIHKKRILDDSIIINRLLNETYCYGHLIGIFPVSVITNSIRIIFAIIVLTKINIYLFIISFSIIPLIIILVNIVKNKSEKAVFDQRNQYETIYKLLKELLQAHTDIKQMKSENQIISHFDDQNNLYIKSEYYLNKIISLTQEASGILFSTLPIFCLFSGIGLTFINKCDIGSTIAFYMYISSFVVPIVNLTDMKINNIQNKKKAEMIQEIIESLNFEDKKNINNNFECNKITINSIIFNYTNKSVQFFKSLTFHKSGLYYVMANSGFGKTTILKLMTKILYSEDTNIIFDNIEIKDIYETNFFDKVTYLNGTPSFIQGSIEDNITYFGKYTFDEKYFELLFNRDENISKNRTLNIGEGNSLSNGQLQRINILRLFAKGTNQKLIVLDEAISGVEEEKEATIIRLLKITFPQAIIILVTHRTANKSLCDYIINLE